jgi:hypothetical protein
MLSGENFVKATLYAVMAGEFLSIVLISAGCYWGDLTMIVMAPILVYFAEAEYSQAKKHYAYLIYKEILDKVPNGGFIPEEDVLKIFSIPYKEHISDIVDTLEKEERYCIKTD